MTSYPKPNKLSPSEKEKMNSEVRVRDRVCQACFTWALVGGDVHHIETRGAHGDAAWRLDNMILLCHGCHVKIGNGEIKCPKPS